MEDYQQYTVNANVIFAFIRPFMQKLHLRSLPTFTKLWPYRICSILVKDCSKIVLRKWSVITFHTFHISHIDKDECRYSGKDLCSRNEKCFDTEGSYKCVDYSCPKNFTKIAHGYVSFLFILSPSYLCWLPTTHFMLFSPLFCLIFFLLHPFSSLCLLKLVLSLDSKRLEKCWSSPRPHRTHN